MSASVCKADLEAAERWLACRPPAFLAAHPLPPLEMLALVMAAPHPDVMGAFCLTRELSFAQTALAEYTLSGADLIPVHRDGSDFLYSSMCLNVLPSPDSIFFDTSTFGNQWYLSHLILNLDVYGYQGVLPQDIAYGLNVNFQVILDWQPSYVAGTVPSAGLSHQDAVQLWEYDPDYGCGPANHFTNTASPRFEVLVDHCETIYPANPLLLDGAGLVTYPGSGFTYKKYKIVVPVAALVHGRSITPLRTMTPLVWFAIGGSGRQLSNLGSSPYDWDLVVHEYVYLPVQMAASGGFSA